MIRKLALNDFPMPLQNIPRTFSTDASLASVLEYFLKNPDISTAVILDSDKKVKGVVTKNDLIALLNDRLQLADSIEKFLSQSYRHLLTEEIDFAEISDYVKNNFEDLIILDQEGACQGMATSWDLAKLLIKEREDQENMYKALLDSAHNGIVVVDRQANVVLFNKAAEKMLGNKSTEVVGRPVTDVISNSRLPVVLKTGQPEITKRHYKGELAFLTNRTPIVCEGSLVGAMAQFVDLAQPDDLLEELSDFNDFINVMEMVLDNAYVGLIFCDAKGVIRFMNRLYEELLGTDRQETYGKHITEYFPDSRLPVVIKTGKAELGWKYRFQNKTTLVVNRIPITKKGKLIGAIAQCIFRDISELKDMARKLDLLENKVRDYESELKNLLTPHYTFDDILGNSESLVKIKRLAKLYARTDAPVLITGETGTGKELFAHAIHGASSRSGEAFVCLNCAALPSELVESELFGYAPGAFTGAHRRGKIGKMRLAHRGTLFLDEIGDLPLPVQAKLLRVIEQKVVERVGGVHPTAVDFRLLAATNRDLPSLIEEGKFREDLYYRLGTMILQVPPLKERLEDIPLLAKHFIRQNVLNRIDISDRALGVLMKQDWRGNIRELKSIIERAVSLVEEGHTIKKEHLSSYFLGNAHSELPDESDHKLPLKENLRVEERNTILKALQICGGNKSKSARMLGISRSLLYNKLKQYEIDPSEFTA